MASTSQRVVEADDGVVGAGRSIALFSCSPAGTVLAVGPSLGGRPGGPAHALLHPSSSAALDEALQAARNGEPCGTTTLRLASGSGSELPVSWSVLAGGCPESSQVVFVGTAPSAGSAFRPSLRVQEAVDRLSREVTVVIDEDGTLLYASPGVTAVLGPGADGPSPTDVWSVLHPDDAGSARAGLRAVVDDGEPRTATLRVRAGTGEWRWVEVAAVSLLDDAIGGVACALHDITAEVEAKQALRAAERRFRALTDTAEEGVAVVDPTGDTLFANERLTTILGMPLTPAYYVELMSTLEFGTSAGMLVRTGGHGRLETAYAHPDGSERRLRVAVTPLHGDDGTPEGTVVMITDITDVRRAEQDLRAAEVQDGLTQLPNRAVLVDRLTDALERAETSTAVLLVALDRFRLLNDSRGHDVGDQLLAGVAARLRAALPAGVTVARFGGDEFAVVCQDADAQRAEAVAAGLRGALSEPFAVDGAAVHVAASVGIAVAPADGGLTALDLLRHADTAVHAAKSAGRGRVHVFDETLGEDVEERYALAADLRAALAGDGLHLEYQPVVDLRSGVVVGLEALARWTHPDRGEVTPTSFVAVAERTGLAPQLDRWSVRRALRDMGALRAAGVVPEEAYVAVNLSACSVADTFAVEDLLGWIEEAGLPPRQLVLEITETAIMENTEAAIRLLRRLREHGVRVAMDDFGTGYSSLAYLRDLPISALKIDRSFVADLTEHPDARAIVASVVALARAVGVAVVAEGVETAIQAAVLHRLGCVHAQGWLWSPAVPVSDLLDGDRWSTPLASAGEANAQARANGEPDAGVAHGLRRLFELHQDGASVATIVATLDAEGYRTPAGRRWHRSSVARVIAQRIRRYAGAPDPSASARGGRHTLRP